MSRQKAVSLVSRGDVSFPLDEQPANVEVAVLRGQMQRGLLTKAVLHVNAGWVFSRDLDPAKYNRSAQRR